jgi:hypothetical protein
VAISMLFVVTIWVLSVKESAKKLRSSNEINFPDISQSLEEIDSIRNSAPSINDIVNNAQEAEKLNQEASNAPSQENKGENNPLLPISDN